MSFMGNFQLIILGNIQLILTIITTNLEFGQWNTVFGDKRLTAAIIDRLVHHAHILSFTGESYRLTHALSKKKALN